jgi:DNA-binding MarR family transcriptional regulator
VLPSPAVGAPSHTALGAELLSVVARLNRMATRRADLPVPYAQARLLAQIEESGPSRVCDLATADHCSQPTMTAQVQRLETGGWARRRPDPSDARAVLVDITPAGRAVLDDIRRRRARVVAPELDGLTAEERATLADGVKILQRVVSAAAAPHTPSHLHQRQ